MEYIRGFIIVGVGGSILVSMFFHLFEYFEYLHNQSEAKRIAELEKAEQLGAQTILKRNYRYLNSDGSINTAACKAKLNESKQINHRHDQLKRKQAEYIDFEIIQQIN